MRPNKLIPLLLLCLASRGLALAPELEKAGQDLVAALQEQAKAQQEADNANDARETRQFIRTVQQTLAQDNIRQLKNWLQGVSGYEHSETVSARVTALETALKDSEANRIRETIATLQSLLADAANTVAKAEQPEELDKVLATLGRNNYNENEDYDSGNREIRSLVQRLNSARQFVNHWQEYLQASNSGNSAKAVQALGNVSSQENGLLPRSQVLARIEHERGNDDDINAIADSVRKPEDMREALRKLSVLVAASRGGSDSASLRETFQTLAKMEKAYREYLAGLPVSMEVFSTTESESTVDRPALVEVRAALLLMILPRALDLPEGLVPAPGENVDAFLARAITETTREGDVAACLRVGNVRRLITRASSDKDMDALRAYAAGQQQLVAGQYALAVSSLQRSIKSGSDLIPAAKAGEMLDSIRKEHPEEFKHGMEEFHNPPPSADPEFMRSIRQNRMMYHMMLHDSMAGRGTPGATTNLVLPVPAPVKKGESPTPTTPPAPATPEAPKVPAAVE